jgi:signal transduction histidine kinase
VAFADIEGAPPNAPAVQHRRRAVATIADPDRPPTRSESAVAWIARRTGWDGSRGTFGVARRVVNDRPTAADAVLAAGLLVVCTVWLAGSKEAGVGAGFLQAALLAPLIWRRRWPTAVMAAVAAVALAQWLVDVRVLADVAVLLALYTVAVHERPSRVVVSTVAVEAGAIMAAIRWSPAGTEPRSFVFLTGLVAAAVFGGLAVRSGSQYLGWMDERAVRLELERDQQAAISAAEERARIAREMHDVVAHSLSVVITLADAASVTPDRDDAAVAMQQVAEVGREALQDMRAVLSALRTDDAESDLRPQPGLSDLDALYRQVRRTGLAVEPVVVGDVPDLPAALERSIYRIVQEALTNTLKHAGASRVDVRIEHGRRTVTVRVHDDGAGHADGAGPGGHGLTGMAERAAIHGGRLSAGPSPDGGWAIVATLPVGR